MGQIPFRDQKFSCGKIQKCHSCAITPRKMHGCQKVIGPMVQQFIAGSQPRGDQLGDPSFHDFLVFRRFFQLVANRHPMPCPDQSGQIGIKCMMRKPCKLHVAATIIAIGKHNAQHSRGSDGIFSKCFIKVAHPKEQDGIFVLGLEAKVLLHKGCDFCFRFCHAKVQFAASLVARY